MTEDRIKSIQNELSKKSGALIENAADLIYLTGLTHSEGYLLILKENYYYITDSRYTEAARKVINSANVVEFSKLFDTVGKLISKHKADTLYIEPGTVSTLRFEKIKSALCGIEVSGDAKIENKISLMRETKSDDEINCIKAAQQITDAGFSYILGKIKSGVTEKEIALDLEFFMRKEGSDGVSFDFVAVSGKNSSLPHGVPTDKTLESGDFLTLDFGAVVNGYHSDMTRTVAIGKITDEQKTVYETVLAAQKSALEFIKSGVKCSDVDKIARDIITNAGYGGCFGHALGHGVGLRIHESPNFSPRSEAVANVGNVITVEPGIYIEDKFGVRIEDMVVVTEDGCENLTKSPKELIII